MLNIFKYLLVVLMSFQMQGGIRAQSPQNHKEKKDIAPKVLVTIKPLYSLTCSLMKGVGQPTLLLKGTEDPHHFSLSPSHAKLIKDSDVIIWIGPVLESFMKKSIMSRKKFNLPLISVKGLTLLHRHHCHGCDLKESSCKDLEERKDDLHKSLNEFPHIDPHIWLDVQNTILMVEAIGLTLASIDPEHAQLYEKNTQDLVEALHTFKEQLDSQALPLEGFQFVAFHDAYGYLEYRYKLKNRAAEMIKGHDKPSLKGYSKIRELIREANVRCLLVDPQHSSVLENTLAKDFQLSLYYADPLGVNISEGSKHYFTLMESLVQMFKECHTKGKS